MSVVVVASPKGGAGKTTVAILVGTEFARQGIEVTFIDCDDTNKSFQKWKDSGPLPDNIKIIHNPTEDQLLDAIENNDGPGKLVVIDLEGIASSRLTMAVSRANLVIIPMRAKMLDAMVGADAINLIQRQERTLRREIKHAAIFTMTRAIASREQKKVTKELYNYGIDIIEPSVMERALFSQFFDTGGDLHMMPDHKTKEQALKNAEQIAESVYERLQSQEEVAA